MVNPLACSALALRCRDALERVASVIGSPVLGGRPRPRLGFSFICSSFCVVTKYFKYSRIFFVALRNYMTYNMTIATEIMEDFAMSRNEQILMELALSDHEGAEDAARALYSLYNGGLKVSLHDIARGSMPGDAKEALLLVMASQMQWIPMEMTSEDCERLLDAYPHLLDEAYPNLGRKAA